MFLLKSGLLINKTRKKAEDMTMKTFLSLGMVLALIFVCGCSTIGNHGQKMSIAGLLTVKQAPEKNNGDYIVDAIIFDEKQGNILVTPKLLLTEGKQGESIFQEMATDNFAFHTKSFGSVLCNFSDGVRFVAIVKKTPEENVVNIAFFLLLQKEENGKVTLYALDVPSIKARLGKSFLVLKRAENYITLPFDSSSESEIFQAHSQKLEKLLTIPKQTTTKKL